MRKETIARCCRLLGLRCAKQSADVDVGPFRVCYFVSIVLRKSGKAAIVNYAMVKADGLKPLIWVFTRISPVTFQESRKEARLAIAPRVPGNACFRHLLDGTRQTGGTDGPGRIQREALHLPASQAEVAGLLSAFFWADQQG